MKRYYPLVDMDSTGMIKVPMFPANDYKTALRKSNFALGEVAHNRYRLIAVTPHAMRDYLSYDIRCPKCGMIMEVTEPHEGEYVLAEYTCENCQ